jgi:hypothetical protein
LRGNQLLMKKMQLKIAFLIFLSLFSIIADSKDVKVFKRGKVSVIDETQFKHPNDYSFDDDKDAADLDNAYDEKVPYLPKFVLHKNGMDQGYTRVPIVTRKGENTWSTPRPTTKRGEEYKTWGTPKILPITKPTPSRPEVSRTTPVPKTTLFAKFSVPPLKPEKPAKKPEVKTKTSPTTEAPATIAKKFFTPRSKSTESTTEIPISIRKEFSRRPSTSASEEISKEVTKSSQKSSSIEVITEDFSTFFSRKGSKPTKTTPASNEEASTKKKFTRKPTTTSTEESTTVSPTRKAFTRRPTSTEGSTEASTEASTRRKFTRRPTTSAETTAVTTEAQSSTRKKFTRRPTSTEATTEASTEASSTKKKFTRRPTTTTSSEEFLLKTKEFTKRPTTTSAETPSSTRKKFTRRPTSAESTTEASTEATSTTRRKFTRKPKPTTTTEEPSTEATTILPLRERLRPMLTTRAPTPTMQQRFRVYTNPLPAEPPSDELNPQQQAEQQRKLKEKLILAKLNAELVARNNSPITVTSSNNRNGVEQTVKSNAIILQAQKNPFFLPSNVTPNPSLFSQSTPSTKMPKVVHRWSSSWSSWSSWDENGHKITGSTKSFTTFDTPETTTPMSTRHRQFSRTRTETAALISSSRSTSRSSHRIPHKPPVIHHGQNRYRGPTYNCRVLTPIEDGRPSSHTDPTCSLTFPGFPADNSCRCTYEVEARDENGCATGFLYTCRKVNRRT